MKQLMAFLLLALSAGVQALPTHYFGEITGSGVYTGQLDTNDSWINPPFGVNSWGQENLNLWGYSGVAGETLNLNFSSDDLNLGFTLFYGEISPMDLLFGEFNNASDTGSAQYLTGASPFFFNPLDISLADLVLEYTGFYTLVVGGRDFGGSAGYGYTMEVVAVPVPEPGMLALMSAGLLGIGALRRRKRHS